MSFGSYYRSGILNDDYIAVDVLEGCADGCAVSLVSIVEQDSYIVTFECPDQFRRPIGRTVIHDNDFDCSTVKCLFQTIY